MLGRLPVTVITALCAIAPGTLQAWSHDAHQATALAMEKLLCAPARQQINVVLGEMSLMEAVVWPDRIRSEARWAHTRDWHYMNIDDDVVVKPGTRTKGGQILDVIHRKMGVLRDPDSTSEERRVALAFLLHLVVDLHQPLHVGRAEDRGGNAFPLRVGDREMSLHQFWDGQILRRARLRPEEYARSLEALIEMGQEDWAKGTPEDWADESRRLRPRVYSLAPHRGTVAVPRHYVEMARHVTAIRLAQASVRSAQLLNELWCP